MEKTVRVGKMPGRINEYAVGVGTSIKDVLNLAELDASGYDIKIDGETGSLDSVVGEGTSLILLAKQVKGNANGTVRVGKMPGRINEYAVEPGASIRDVLSLAELDADGYDIKIDGETGSLDSTVTDSTNLILLAKQVKGNR